jgi:hypothetical protein
VYHFASLSSYTVSCKDVVLFSLINDTTTGCRGPFPMSTVQPPTHFWPSTAAQPSAAAWFQWKTSFTDYIDLLDAFNPTSPLSESSKLKLLRHNLGDEGQKLFDALDLRDELTTIDAFGILDRSWGVSSNVFTSRFKFSQIRQESGETLENFITRLIQGIRPCDYSSIPQRKIETTLLTQQLIIGISDDRIREHLLSENSSKLTWERCCDIARAKVDAQQQSKLFKVVPPAVSLSKLGRLRMDDATSSRSFQCFRCGSTSHRANYPQCPARTASCRKCGKQGHFAKCCRSVQVAELSTCDDDPKIISSAHHIFAIGSQCQYAAKNITEPKLPHPDVRTVYFRSVNRDVPIDMELDSASPITTISKTFYEKHLSHLPINPSVYSFGSYTGNLVPVYGLFMVSH